jgi:hypothetical protein
MLDFNIEFTPETPEEREEARKWRIINLTDKYPALAQAMHGKSWSEIYQIPMVRQIP